MPNNVVGSIPEFTTDETVAEEVKQASDKETGEQQTETASELPAEQQPADQLVGGDSNVEKQYEGLEKNDLLRAVDGLKNEAVNLRKEIDILKGERRKLWETGDKQKESLVQNDPLDDIAPQDVSVVEKILRAKGYITKEESEKAYYESVKKEELNNFLEKYPEYKPENDPYDTNWKAFEKELSYYRMPSDPKLIGDLLVRAHKVIAKPVTAQNTQATQQRLKTASMGGGGAQRASSQKSFSAEKRIMLQQGGWSEDEIKKMEQNIEE